MFGEDQIAQQLSQVRETVSQGPGPAGAQSEPILTEAADGRIKVTLGTDGRFERIKMTLSALKDGPDALVEELKNAVNEALDQRSAATTYTGPVPDPAAMHERMSRMQDASIQQFAQINASVRDLMARLEGGR
jgi:DNA-binding protein YbaB